MPLVFVHKYKYSHDAMRKRARRYCKDQKIKLILKNSDGFLYDVPCEYFEIVKTGKSKRCSK